MASDDDQKDEELVDFEGSDYEVDGDYEDEDFEEGKWREDLGSGEHLDPLDAEALYDCSNGASKPLQDSFSEFAERSPLEGTQFLAKLNAAADEDCKEGASWALADEDSKEGASRALGCAEGISKVFLQNQEAVGSAVTVSTDVASSSDRVNVGSKCRNSKSSCMRMQEKGGKNVERQTLVTWNQRDCSAMSGPAPNERSDAIVVHSEPEFADGRPGSKPDLEDGELEETAVPQNLDYIAEEEIMDQCFGRGKKRKTECSQIGMHKDDHALKQSERKRDYAGKQHSNPSSAKGTEHFIGLSCAGGRGMGVRMVSPVQGSLAPGIMGPGRPVIPISLASLAQEFNRFRGITQPGRLQVHLQEVLAQQHLLRAHAPQLAPETFANAMQSSVARPLGALTLQPLISFDVPGPRSHTQKSFLRPLPDLAVRPIGNFAIGDLPNSPAVMADIVNKAKWQGDTHLYNGVGRQFGRPSVAVSNEALRRGCTRGGDLQRGLYGDVTQAFGPIPTGLGSAGHPRSMINALLPESMQRAHSNDTILYQMPSGAFQAKSDLIYNTSDVKWKTEKQKMLKNGLPYVWTTENAISGRNVTCKRETIKDLENSRETKFSGSQNKTDTVNIGCSTQLKLETSIKTDLAEVAAASTVINLHQPVRKSRMLLVSGLPDDTPSSKIIEVFEKLGKITVST